MVKNVRWLYNKLGTDDFSTTGSDTVTGALSNLQSGLNGKAESSHSHTTDTLPVSNNQVNSVNYIPTSALLYSMSQRAEEIQSVVVYAKSILDDPNKRYESVSLGTWSSVSDVTTFLSKYTHDNGYYDSTTDTKLKLGNYVTISDGTYNAVWEIAGFDMESGQLAADGSIYDNGYGICMIPKTHVTASPWNATSTTSGGYISSYMHTYKLPTIVNKLKTVLGTHVVNRNVLLSSSITSVSNSGYSNAYTWTTAEATLMSVGQMDGTFASYSNKYDDGEANYKLPLFDYENYKTGSSFWSRGVESGYNPWYINAAGSSNSIDATENWYVRPLIYIRLDTSANSRYNPKNLGTWSSVSDVDTFLNTYNHANNYCDPTTGTELSVGDYVTIQDGIYNVQWVIAGFDCEHNQTAADGTVYDNGYGICMIPKTQVTTGKWNTSNTTTGGYKSSNMHNTILPNIVTKLKNVLGDHIVNRNVLLSSTVTSGKSSAYTWTTAEATLMSTGQMTGIFDSYSNKYDDGEANYKLPLFNYKEYKTGSLFWSRGVLDSYYIWIVYSDGNTDYNIHANDTSGVRPLIYIR